MKIRLSILKGVKKLDSKPDESVSLVIKLISSTNVKIECHRAGVISVK